MFTKERDRMNEHIGAKIKHLRTQRKMTLKDLSEKTNLSIGFLSQLERGLTSIATDTLGTIADVFEVELSYFFLKPRTKKKATFPGRILISIQLKRENAFLA